MNKKIILTLTLITLAIPQLSYAAVSPAHLQPQQITWQQSFQARFGEFKTSTQNKLRELQNKKAVKNVIAVAQKPVSWIATAFIVVACYLAFVAKTKKTLPPTPPANNTAQTTATPSPDQQLTTPKPEDEPSVSPRKKEIPGSDSEDAKDNMSTSSSDEGSPERAPKKPVQRLVKTRLKKNLANSNISLNQTLAQVRTQQEEARKRDTLKADELEFLKSKYAGLPGMDQYFQDLDKISAALNESRSDLHTLEKGAQETQKDIEQLEGEKHKARKNLLAALGNVSKSPKQI